MRRDRAVLFLLCISTAARGATVMLSPGDEIQAAVDSHGAGSEFHLAAGLYRIQSVQPKNGDAFVGDTGAVLDGAKLLTDFQRAGSLYVARHQPIDPNTSIQGVCLKGYPRCGYPQDLYFDGTPLRAVAKRAKVVSGTFFYDYPHDAVYFADDPSGHTVELSYRAFAFGGAARGVTIQNLTIENYAAADQQGALGNHGEGKGWIMLGNHVLWNHGMGIATGSTATVRGNLVEHNGEMGMGGGGNDGTLIDGNEIAFNVWNGTDCGWECGGAKWAVATHLTVRNNSVHDNQGDGLWTDIDSTNVIYEGNSIENNLNAGISHEISGAAAIRNNILKSNGATTFGWGWHGQIQIQNSSDTEVRNNTLVLDPARGGNGIMIIQQKRGARHMPRNNSIHDNDVTMAGGEGAVAGWFADYKPWAFATAGNLFDHNRYHVYAPDDDFWAPNEWTDFPAWQATGQDVHSTVNAARHPTRRE